MDIVGTRYFFPSDLYSDRRYSPKVTERRWKRQLAIISHYFRLITIPLILRFRNWRTLWKFEIQWNVFQYRKALVDHYLFHEDNALKYLWIFWQVRPFYQFLILSDLGVWADLPAWFKHFDFSFLKIPLIFYQIIQWNFSKADNNGGNHCVRLR